MKVLVKLYDGSFLEYENVVYVSHTIEGINIFGKEIEWINIVMQNFNTEKITNGEIENINIVEF